ncbi:hypothetical protein [Providencia alcalifaciens]|uniref:hypothetical protein n=1 Tax=Providencia alcalifaciens TaxID=126385 RepID=UPI001CC47092|nr:hypothetical protein [Providencia alcalifaciens]CAG9415779.1 hypothetical protein NVI2019_GHJFPKLH_01302 [Providencia alcalifaciens]
MKTHAELHSEWIQDPEYRRAYEIEERNNMSSEIVILELEDKNDSFENSEAE